MYLCFYLLFREGIPAQGVNFMESTNKNKGGECIYDGILQIVLS